MPGVAAVTTTTDSNGLNPSQPRRGENKGWGELAIKSVNLTSQKLICCIQCTGKEINKDDFVVTIARH
jgi:hypothetical protein